MDLSYIMAQRCNLSMHKSLWLKLFQKMFTLKLLIKALNRFTVLQVIEISTSHFVLLQCIWINMNANVKNATVLQHRFVDKSIINNYDTSPLVRYTLLVSVCIIACCCIILVLLHLQKICKSVKHGLENFDAASTTGNLNFSKSFSFYIYFFVSGTALYIS